MYCPKCGQQQSSDEMRFCSRCGFQLGVVSALIATGGAPPAIIINEALGKPQRFSQRGTRNGAKLMFAGGVLTPIAMGFSILFDSPFPLFFPFTVFLFGLAWLLYFRWFGSSVSTNVQAAFPVQLAKVKEHSLPPAQTQFTGARESQNTAEMLKPSSVTEHTTKLLREE